MTMRALFIAAGVAATALTGWLLFPHGERGRTAPAATAHHDESDKRLAAMNDRLASLERGMAARRSGNDAPAAAPAPTAPETGDRAQAGDSPRSAPQPTADEVASGLEKQLAHGPKDPVWSAQAQAGIANAFRSESLAGSSVLRADCAASFCRVDVSHSSAAAKQGFLWNVRLVPPFDKGGLARQFDDPDTGESKTVVYVVREGHDLPMPEEG
jgi:hypothetical protein